MKIQKKYVYTFLIIIFLLTGMIIALKFWRYGVFIPSAWEKFVARPSDSPVKTFDSFQTALAKEDDNYLKYITRDARVRYKKLFADKKIRERYLEPIVNMQEIYIVPCENTLTCERLAVYSYDYHINEPYWEESAGNTILVPAGTHKLEMTFVEIKKGYWQINEF